MHDQFDISLEDSDLLSEVELTTTLIIAASESDGPLTLEQIDALLGVRHTDGHGEGQPDVGAGATDEASAAGSEADSETGSETESH